MSLLQLPLKFCIHERAVRMRRISWGRLINFPQTWGEQRTPGAWKEHPAHSVLFVFTQKTNKYRLRTVQRRFAVPSTHTRIWFANHSTRSCIRGFTNGSILSSNHLEWRTPRHTGFPHSVHCPAPPPTLSGPHLLPLHFSWFSNLVPCVLILKSFHVKNRKFLANFAHKTPLLHHCTCVRYTHKQKIRFGWNTK